MKNFYKDININTCRDGNGHGHGNGRGHGYGSGDGYRYGDGYIDGDGYGYGRGHGYGHGHGHGHGNGSGHGHGYGYGHGDGYGYGSGYGNGNGSGHGHGSGFVYKNRIGLIHLKKHQSWNAYHFCCVEDGKLRLRDLKIKDIHSVLHHKEKLILCTAGFHASLTIKDARQYAPINSHCFMVKVWGKIILDEDKLVAEYRQVTNKMFTD
jgi:hypothetical protein